MKNSAKIAAMVLTFMMIVTMAACGCEHVIVIDRAVSATCTGTGLTEGRHCDLCNEVLVAQATILPTGHSEKNVEEVPATCTEYGRTAGVMCTKCQKVLNGMEVVSPLGHTTDAGMCDRCQESIGIYARAYYVDSFKQPTNDMYIYNTEWIVGTFSNSATTDSTLYVKILADKDDDYPYYAYYRMDFAIQLYEYGEYLVKNSSRDTEKYNIQCQIKGDSHTCWISGGWMSSGGDRIHLDGKCMLCGKNATEMLLDAFSQGKSVMFLISPWDRAITEYLFTIEASNFAEEYRRLR